VVTPALAVHVLHDQAEVVVGRPRQLVDMDDVGVVEAGLDAGFALEAAHVVGEEGGTEVVLALV
jgi:hypothetical protein